MKYKVIANPAAGKGTGQYLIPKVEAELQRQGIPFDLVRTEYSGHACELAKAAAEKGYDVIAAAGGDGTVNEVLNGLMLAQQAGLGKARLGVICVGRGNDFAFGAGLSTAWEEGCRVIATGKPKQIDIGKVNGDQLRNGERFFGNGVGIGFDAIVNIQASKTRLNGFLNYMVAALRTLLLYFQAPTVRIECDGESLTQAALMISIMNGRRMGGGFLMTPDSSISDGILDLCIARKVSRATILMMLPRFMKGTQGTHPAVRFLRSQRVHVTALKGTLTAHADGETICTDCREMAVEIFPGQMEVMAQTDSVTP